MLVQRDAQFFNPLSYFIPVDTTRKGMFVELLTEDGSGSPVNPLSIGFRPQDRIQIVNVDPNGDARAETQPIIDVQTDRIVVRRLRYDYDGDDASVNPRVYGARIGMYPQAIMMTTGQNDELEQATYHRTLTPFYFNPILDRGALGGTNGDFSGDATSGAGEISTNKIHYAQLSTHAQTNDEYGSGITGNERTLRMTIRSVAIGNQTGSILMKIPRLAAFNGTASYYPHDNHLRDRASPQEDFISFRFASSSTKVYVVGPTPA